MNSDGRPQEPILILDGVTRLFGRHPALVKASLCVSAGDVVALVGPNGAGKTTLLRVAATALRPTFGRGTVNGADVVRERARARRSMCFLGHQDYLYDDLTCEENARFWATMNEAPRSLVGWALEWVGLLGEAATRVRALSYGQRRRLALAGLIVRRPALVLLDEPYAGLDEDGKRLVDGLISECRSEGRAEGRAVVVASHDVERSARFATRVVTLEQGRVAGDMPARESLAREWDR